MNLGPIFTIWFVFLTSYGEMTENEAKAYTLGYLAEFSGLVEMFLLADQVKVEFQNTQNNSKTVGQKILKRSEVEEIVKLINEDVFSANYSLIDEGNHKYVPEPPPPVTQSKYRVIFSGDSLTLDCCGNEIRVSSNAANENPIIMPQIQVRYCTEELSSKLFNMLQPVAGGDRPR